tara:strand:+ start:801 stop:1346 length:546 start_codon:yes stop_codon:yes gene_type:complete
MAKTDIQKYTVQEKLNKMDLDLIDVTVKPDFNNGAGMGIGDFMFPIVEIPNAVSVEGGTAVLQSCCAVIAGGDADGADTGTFEIVVTSDSSTLQHGGGDIETDDDMASVTSALSVMDGTCGFFSISNAYDSGVVAIGFRSNIGMVCKASARSRSLYVYGIVQNTADYNEGDIVLRFGFLKD